MSTLSARCHCTMEINSTGEWIEPKSGYKKPDENCPHCGGEGVLVAKILNFMPTWLGRCRICGINNGVHFCIPGEEPKKAPLSDKYTVCMFDKSHGPIEWINEISVTKTFETICPICNASSWFFYLQRQGDPFPSTQITCQKCGHVPISWQEL